MREWKELKVPPFHSHYTLIQIPSSFVYSEYPPYPLLHDNIVFWNCLLLEDCKTHQRQKLDLVPRVLHMVGTQKLIFALMDLAMYDLRSFHIHFIHSEVDRRNVI